MKKGFFFILLLGVILPVEGQLQLPYVLSDNMVLQQNSTVRIWGEALPNSLVKVIVDWSKESVSVHAESDGTWEAIVKTSLAGGPYTMTISSKKEKKVLKNILLGEVWICSGQSNMEMPLRGFTSQPVHGALDAIIESNQYDQIRMFTAKKTIADKKKKNVEGVWVSASVGTVAEFSAVGYYYAMELYKALKVPIGMLHISWGGSSIQAWMSLENLKMFPEFNESQIDMMSKSPMRIPTALYNGMFHPIRNYNVKGIIWYQGEANIRESELYSRMFPNMVKEWRNNIGLGDIPFYFVQIAPYKYEGSKKITSALLREVQLRCEEFIPNSKMIVTIDVGEENNIHPNNKSIVGKRLAYAALANTYDFTGLPYLYPTYSSMRIDGNKVKITFKNTASGLISTSEVLEGFEIADSAFDFKTAKAKIVNENHIEVWNDSISTPIEVRYCFKNFQKGSLTNTFGFPCSSFRATLK